MDDLTYRVAPFAPAIETFFPSTFIRVYLWFNEFLR